MLTIFISYRRDDSAAHAGRIYDYLAAHYGDDQIFMDIEDIAPGRDFMEVIEERVAACDVQLVIIGKHWANIRDEHGRQRLENADDGVRMEIAAALKRDIVMVPLLVGGAKMPRALELPPELEPLLRRQAVEINDRDFRQDMEHLVGSLESASSAEPAVAMKGFGGTWNAELNYGANSWSGRTYHETFQFAVAGNELMGTASFVEYPRPILEGVIKGQVVSFVTRFPLVPEGTQENRYRGTVIGDEIRFIYQSMDGSPPLTFTAKRAPSSDAAG